MEVQESKPKLDEYYTCIISLCESALTTNDKPCLGIATHLAVLGAKDSSSVPNIFPNFVPILNRMWTAGEFELTQLGKTELNTLVTKLLLVDSSQLDQQPVKDFLTSVIPLVHSQMTAEIQGTLTQFSKKICTRIAGAAKGY